MAPRHYHFMRMGVFLSLILTFAVPGIIMARIVEAWTYQEMFDKADLVAVALAVSTKDIGEHSTLLNDIKVIGVITEFKSGLILKGPKNTATFQLHHYRLQSRKDEDILNGPNLIRTGPQHRVFLLFLTKEKDGRYVPVTGQTDPAVLSILELTGAGATDPLWLDIGR